MRFTQPREHDHIRIVFSAGGSDGDDNRDSVPLSIFVIVVAVLAGVLVAIAIIGTIVAVDRRRKRRDDHIDYRVVQRHGDRNGKCGLDPEIISTFYQFYLFGVLNLSPYSGRVALVGLLTSSDIKRSSDRTFTYDVF